MPTFPPLHQDLTFLSPLSEERADRLVAFLTGHAPTTVLDVGCGWAELLLRVLAAAPGATGLGIDLDEESLARAASTAASRGLRGRVRFEARDARVVRPVRTAQARDAGPRRVPSPVCARPPPSFRPTCAGEARVVAAALHARDEGRHRHVGLSGLPS